VPLEGPLSFFTAHLLTWLLALPLLGAFIALAMHIIGYKEDERLRGVVLATTAFQCLLAILLYEGFNGTVTRIDGNDGFQFIERVVLLHSVSVEYFVGVDGLNVSLVLLTAVVGFAASLASYGVTLGRCRYYGFLSLLLAGAMGVFVSLDLAVLALSWGVMLVALVGLLATGAPRTWSRAAVKLTVYAAISALLLAFAATALYLHSDPTYLADGARADHTFAVPELMRVAYNAKHLTLLGCSWVKVVWVALFIAFAILIPLVPLHGWFIDLIGDAPAPVSAVLAGVVMNAGLYGLLRVSFGIFPDGSRWAATTLVAAGVVTLAFAAMSALRQTDLLKIAAYATVGQAGFSLVGLGALTREGIAACLIQMFSHGIVMAMLFLLLGVVRDRVKTTDVAAMGLARRAPVLGVAVGVALLASSGVPGFAGFWGEIVALLGAFPVERTLVLAAAVFGAVTVAYHLRALGRAWAVPAAGDAGDAAGGKVHDLTGREFTALAPLLLLSLALGVWPAPFFNLVRGAVSDLNQLVNPPGPDEIARGNVETTGARRIPPAYSRVETSLAIAPRGRSPRG
jgi:NADH-quinone oxidoreductase subunit M